MIFAVLLIVIVLCLVAIAVQNAMARTTTEVHTSLNPEHAGATIEQQFNARLNSISRSGNDRYIRPRLKRNAPTLHVEVSPNGEGSTVRMHGTVHMEKRGFAPWTAQHGLWVWRRQRRLAAALETTRQKPTKQVPGVKQGPFETGF